MGKTVEKFEKKISKQLDVKHALLVNNGTSAIHLCLLAIGIKKGSGEKMRKPGAKGAPTAANFKRAAKTAKR